MSKNLHDMFEKYNDDYTRFEKVLNKLSQRPDLHAFLLLDAMLPGQQDMICAAKHGEIYLNIDSRDFEKIATQEQIHELVCCGVSYSYNDDAFWMFV